jgi:hypothetical protein
MSFWFESDDSKQHNGPVVDIWSADPTSEGRAVFVFGEKPDGQRFFGSFFEPALDGEDGAR